MAMTLHVTKAKALNDTVTQLTLSLCALGAKTIRIERPGDLEAIRVRGSLIGVVSLYLS